MPIVTQAGGADAFIGYSGTDDLDFDEGGDLVPLPMTAPIVPAAEASQAPSAPPPQAQAQLPQAWAPRGPVATDHSRRPPPGAIVPSRHFTGQPAPAPGPRRRGVGQDPAAAPPPNHLGLVLTTVAAGAVAGGVYKGALGALGGALAGAGLANAIRAITAVQLGDPDADKEAMVAGTYSLIDFGIAGYIAYRLFGDESPSKVFV